MRILIVEDNVAQAESLAVCLRADGHEPFLAGNGHQARTQVEVHRIDAAVIDLHMPGECGRFLLTWLRSRSKTAYIPVVISTGSPLDDLRDLTNLPHTRVLQKPYEVSTLLKTILQLGEGSTLHTPPPGVSP